MLIQIDKKIFNEISPVEKRGGLYFKREDYFRFAGVNGAKVRDCLALINGKDIKGLVTAGSRDSPQVNIVAHIANYFKLPCRAHIPEGKLCPETLMAKSLGMKIIQHKMGFNNVLNKKARDDAEKLGWFFVPFAMQCEEAIQITKHQVKNIPKGAKRIVVACGSGVNLCGILTGLKEYKIDIPVLAVKCGAKIENTLKKFLKFDWQKMVKIVKAKLPYHKPAPNKIKGVIVDPIYEAKAIPFLKKGDLFWIIGRRKTIYLYG
jgi:1-aminocyclopropane-1-carboxylate deaminase/D-cysteine desulfhydrase-like pyridoxal-dependent ACC family enzyme